MERILDVRANGNISEAFCSGVARTFPGGRATHPKDQIEEEKEKN